MVVFTAVPQIVFDDGCLAAGARMCGVPIQCPPAGAGLVANACYR